MVGFDSSFSGGTHTGAQWHFGSSHDHESLTIQKFNEARKFSLHHDMKALTLSTFLTRFKPPVQKRPTSVIQSKLLSREAKCLLLFVPCFKKET